MIGIERSIDDKLCASVLGRELSEMHMCVGMLSYYGAFQHVRFGRPLRHVCGIHKELSGILVQCAKNSAGRHTRCKLG